MKRRGFLKGLLAAPVIAPVAVKALEKVPLTTTSEVPDEPVATSCSTAFADSLYIHDGPTYQRYSGYDVLTPEAVDAMCGISDIQRGVK